MDNSKNVLRKTAMMITLCLPLLGCKETLYSDLQEKDANEMVAVLAVSGINASRISNKDNKYTVLVDEVEIPAATIKLRNAGLPRPVYESIGDVFSASGIIGTPFEQHARYIHAMNQEISGMLASIEGVEDADVIVNSPPATNGRREAPPATAAITIHHEPNFKPAEHLPRLKQLVSHSIPSLPYDNVAIAFYERSVMTVEVTGPLGDVQPLNAANIMGDTDLSTLRTSPVILLLALIFVIICTVAMALQRKPTVKKSKDPVSNQTHNILKDR